MQNNITLQGTANPTQQLAQQGLIDKVGPATGDVHVSGLNSVGVPLQGQAIGFNQGVGLQDPLLQQGGLLQGQSLGVNQGLVGQGVPLQGQSLLLNQGLVGQGLPLQGHSVPLNQGLLGQDPLLLQQQGVLLQGQHLSANQGLVGQGLPLQGQVLLQGNTNLSTQGFENLHLKERAEQFVLGTGGATLNSHAGVATEVPRGAGSGRLTVFNYPFSQPGRAVAAFLLLTKIDHETKVVDIFKDEQFSPEFKKINPQAKVPAIDDNGFHLFESEAIIRYLINSRGVGQDLYPADPKIRYMVDRYFPFNHSVFRPGLIAYFVANNPEKFTFVEKKPTLAEAEPAIAKALEQFQDIYLRDQNYIAGDQLTIADLFAMGEISLVYYVTKFDFNKYPKVKAYMERLAQNPVINQVNKPLIDAQKQAQSE